MPISKPTASAGPDEETAPSWRDGGAPPHLDEQLVDAVLLGGPASFPESLRERRVHVSDAIVKVLHLNGYEHFERCTDEAADGTPVAFQWSFRTKIAE